MPFTHHPARNEVATGARPRRARRRLAALLPAAAAIVATTAALPAGAATPARAARPDLVVTIIKVKELPGTPPYIAIDEATRAPGFVVKVVTKNIGDGPAKKSVTDLKLQEKGETLWGHLDDVGPLTAGMYRTSTFVVDDLKADPGMLVAVGTANFTRTINEPTGNDVTTRRPIPVIPRDWNVSVFSTNVDPGGGVFSNTQTGNGFYFRFSRFDEVKKWFVYKAYGRINDKAQFSGAGCTAGKSAHDTNDPWPGTGSELRIKGDLTEYSASVDLRSEPAVTFNFTCKGVTIPEAFAWNSLLTPTLTSALPSMTPDLTTLDGQLKMLTPVGPATFTWTFNARISGV